MDNYKRRFGDRKDGRLIRHNELDTNHFVMPIIWPRRCENEAFISETMDLTKVEEFLRKKNEKYGSNHYSLLMFILAAYGKVFINRPKLNRFIKNRRLYERFETTIGFIVKKKLTDDGDEALARIVVDKNDTFETFAEKVIKQIEFCRSEQIDKSSDELRVLMKFPHFIGKLVLDTTRLLDRYGLLPEDMVSTDMFFCSMIFSHLGSIKLHAGYHHLANWGTNSFFTIIGERKMREFMDDEGNKEMKSSIDLGMTIDERIADGYYYSKSIKLLKKYFNHPEMLETPFKENE